MTNDALINNKVVELTDEEKAASEKFHKSRLPFIWIDNKLIINENEDDDRDHQHWVCEDFGLTIPEFEALNRGYMIEGRIQFFRSSTFEMIDTSEISVEDFNKLLKIQHSRYNTDKVVVCNGVHIGKVGEIWEPISVLGTFDTII